MRIEIMDNDKLNRWLRLGANIGVLVGIALLIYELNQNRELMRAQVRHDLSAGLVEILGWVATDPQMASIVRRGDRNEELTPDEEYQYRYRTNALFRYWQDVHYQYRLGLYDESQYLAHRNAIAGYIKGSRRMVDFWCNAKESYDSAFRHEIDSLSASGR
jgi:hypothetical protein